MAKRKWIPPDPPTPVPEHCPVCQKLLPSTVTFCWHCQTDFELPYREPPACTRTLTRWLQQPMGERFVEFFGEANISLANPDNELPCRLYPLGLVADMSGKRVERWCW
jgi:hypothetical protein